MNMNLEKTLQEIRNKAKSQIILATSTEKYYHPDCTTLSKKCQEVREELTVGEEL